MIAVIAQGGAVFKNSGVEKINRRGSMSGRMGYNLVVIRGELCRHPGYFIIADPRESIRTDQGVGYDRSFRLVV